MSVGLPRAKSLAGNADDTIILSAYHLAMGLNSDGTAGERGYAVDGSYNLQPPGRPLDFPSLWRIHGRHLRAKRIEDGDKLLAVQRYDFGKFIRAVAKVRSIRVDSLLREVFFEGHADLAQAVLALAPWPWLNHMGLEIHQPFDVLLHCLDDWSDGLNRIVGRPVQVEPISRFPASPALRRRVGAYTEILCLKLCLDGQVSILELFNIARPVDCLEIPMFVEADALDIACPRVASAVFANDTIQHYSIGLENRQAVESIHRQLWDFAKQWPKYQLVYDHPVANRHDGSFHTKVARLALGMELEFCAGPGPAGAGKI
ncbi:hypothetical protein SAMN02949497_0567 [Methylomagnum ishizawai]|uniref:Uncharacterized protein n=1 Tax=Methylomagnum ishizawai TaxID=1760988 RepID=A0A1Y6CSW4_9GAMM|nr:hypothetical protein SAMN02949497_0567 [Methylomagnum ishizawai]